MTTDVKQAVVDETDTKPKAGSEVESARSDGDELDKLLAEFDQQTKPAPVTQPEAKPTPKDTEPVIPDRIRKLEDRLFQEDLNETVTNIVGDLKIPRRAAMGWLDQMARENPAIGQAFLNKSTNPQAWKRLEKVLSKEIEKEFSALSPVDREVTEDVAAVAAAVRGASTRVPEEPAPNYAGQSNAEYRQSIRKQYGFDPGV